MVLLSSLVLAHPGPAALVAHWTFDSDLSDAAGSNDLTAAGSAAAGNSGGILGGGALGGASGGYLNGTTDQAATSGNFGISGSGTRTLSAWFKAPADPGAPDDGPTLLGMGTSAATGNRFDIRLSNSTASIASNYDGYLRAEFQGGARQSTADLGVDNDAWHHVMVTYTGGNASTVTMYLDGKVISLAAGTTALDTSAAPFVVGGSNHITDTERNFHGLIDDVGVWNTSLAASDAALVNGLARIGGNNLSGLAAAAALWGGSLGDTAEINGTTWMKTDGLAGTLGDWSQLNGSNGNGSFIVLDGAGSGIAIVPEPASALLGSLGLLALLRRRR